MNAERIANGTTAADTKDFSDAKPGAWSPWGAVQGKPGRILPGMYWVDTAGHGGIVLSMARADYVNRLFPLAQSWTGDSRYWEEDCDFAVPTIAFAREIVARAYGSEYGGRRSVWNAVRTARTESRRPRNTEWMNANNARLFDRCRAKWLHVCEYLDGAGGDVQAIHDLFAAEVRDLWERGSMSSVGAKSRGNWMVHFRRDRDGARRVVEMPYPLKVHFTTEELDAAEKTAAVVAAS